MPCPFPLVVRPSSPGKAPVGRARHKDGSPWNVSRSPREGDRLSLVFVLPFINGGSSDGSDGDGDGNDGSDGDGNDDDGNDIWLMPGKLSQP